RSLLIFGIPVLILLPTVGRAVWRALAYSRAPAPTRLILVGMLGIVLIMAVVVPLLALRVALSFLLLLISVPLLQRKIGPAAWFTLLLAWLAWAVLLGSEVVYIRDHLDGDSWYRMNTVFKFGIQSWVLISLAAAASLSVGLRALRRISGLYGQMIGLVGLAVLGALAAVYPLAAVPSRVANRFSVQTGLTLDGLAFMRQASFDYDCVAYGGCPIGANRVTVDLHGDAAAIDWLNRTIGGTPVVVQSDLWFYRAYGVRIAANTGLPTVISSLHENEQRAPSLVGVRSSALADFYTTTNIEQALRFLATYHVGYIYIGGVERAFYPVEGLAKFAAMEGSYLRRVYDADQVLIYQVYGVPTSYAIPAPLSRPATTDHPDLPTGETGAEIAALEQALAANPSDGSTAFGLADRYRALGRLEEAVRVLAPAARANPADVGLHHLLGDILSDLGRYEEAEDAYLAAAQADPSAGNWNKLGAALLAWGKLDKAELALDQAIMLEPNLPDPHYHLGRLFAQRREREPAISEIQVYLALAPDGPWAADASTLLADLSP
ncbi:MAG: tetratricopeptide repeat protein, partial [Oscillochloris sp.]|nr:tetratricopeptide repeat protein [Oscillochloris sp.]